MEGNAGLISVPLPNEGRSTSHSLALEQRSNPHLAVEHAVVNGFLKVFEVNVAGISQIGDRPRRTEYFVVRARREADFIDTCF